jgi:hypothetical protein
LWSEGETQEEQEEGLDVSWIPVTNWIASTVWSLMTVVFFRRYGRDLLRLNGENRTWWNHILHPFVTQEFISMSMMYLTEPMHSTWHQIRRWNDRSVGTDLLFRSSWDLETLIYARGMPSRSIW